MQPEHPAPDPTTDAPHGFERIGLALSDWSERWFPDAFVFALLAIAVVFVLGLLAGESPSRLALEGGKSFWVLVPFTMQMAMVIIGGYVVASSPPVHRAIVALAAWPRTGRGAVALVALFSMLTSLVSWGFSLIFSGLLVRELSRRLDDLDYRAAGAAGYLGLGAVWALGLSSSAALMMATRSAIPPALLATAGVIPLTQTLFTPQNLMMAAVLLALSTAIAWASAPTGSRVRNAKAMGLAFEPLESALEPQTRPGEWLEYSPLLSLGAVALLAWYLVDLFRRSPQGALAALDLNTYNLMFLVLGMLLHWRPRRFLRAVGQAVPAAGGVLVQFPFYAVIFGMIAGTGLSKALAHAFVSVTTQGTYPVLVAIYSAVLGVFVPSGGSKWVIEAPYVLDAAIQHRVNLGWVVQIYNAAEALPNLLNPFWMLPLLGILRVKARDLVGYSTLQLALHVPVVIFLCWLLARYVPFVPAVH